MNKQPAITRPRVVGWVEVELVVDFRIRQLVDRMVGVYAIVPKSILGLRTG